MYLVLKRPNDALKTYTQLLTYTKSAVTRNYSEKTINGILDYVGGGKGGTAEVNVLEKFYQATLKALEDAKNDVSDPTLSPHPASGSDRIFAAIIGEDKPEACQTLVGQKGIRSAVQGACQTHQTCGTRYDLDGDS